MAPLLGYWNIRGFAEPVRLLLHYLGVEFEEKVYRCGPAPDYDKSEWLNVKYTLGLDFPNLPYYVDGDFKLSQSNAILEYIADKHGMTPKCKKENAILHMLLCDITDVRLRFVLTCYNPDFENLKVQMVADIREKLKIYDSHLCGKLWLAGEKINYPDFNLCEFLNQMEKFDSKFLDNFPNLKAYLTRFENLPQLKDYMNSLEFKNRPCNNVTAMWI